MHSASLILSLSFIFATCAFAQQKVASPEEVIKEEQKKMMQEMQVQQERDLEMLKKSSPAVYQEIISRKQKQEEISKIVSAYQKNQITEASARIKLESLIKEEVNEELKIIDARIGELERQLNSLKEKRRVPSKIIQERIDLYLGKSSPRPGEETAW
jgi:hypothetical protein